MGDLQEDRSGEYVLTPCIVTCHSTETIPHSPRHGSWAKSNSASKSSPSLTWGLPLTQLVTPWSPYFSCWSPCHWLLLSLCRWPLHISEFCIQSNLHPQNPPLLYFSSFSRTSIRLMALKTSLMLLAPNLKLQVEMFPWNLDLVNCLLNISSWCLIGSQTKYFPNQTSNPLMSCFPIYSADSPLKKVPISSF